MKRFSLLVSILFLSAAAYAQQGTPYQAYAINSAGQPAGGATVRICTSVAVGTPCSPLAQIYRDINLTVPIPNPTTADPLGNFYFYAGSAVYQAQISGSGITTYTYPIATPVVANVSNTWTAAQNFTISNNVYWAEQFASGSLTGGLQEAYAACQAAGNQGCSVKLGADESLNANGVVTIATGKPVTFDCNYHAITVSPGSGIGMLFVDDSTYNSTRATLKNCWIKYGGSATNVTGVSVRNTDFFSMDNVVVSGFNTSGSTGLSLDGALVGSVTNSSISGNATDLLLKNGSNLNVFINDAFSTGSALAVNIQASSNDSFKSNDFEGNTGTYTFQIDATNGNIVETSISEGNYFSTNGDGTSSSATFNFVTPSGKFIIGTRIQGNFLGGQVSANGYAFNYSTTGTPNDYMIREGNYYAPNYANADLNRPSGNFDTCRNENYTSTGAEPVCDTVINDHNAGSGSIIANFLINGNANPAASGFVRLPYSGSTSGGPNSIVARNSSNTGDVPLIQLMQPGGLGSVVVIGGNPSTAASQPVYMSLFSCGADCQFQFSSVGTTSTIHNFGHTFFAAPNCFVQPEADVGSGNRYWVTTSTSALTLTTSSNTTLSWFAHCEGY